MFPHVGCRGPHFDYFVTAGNKNCIDLNRFCLVAEIWNYQPDGNEKLRPADVHLTLANNTLHFSLSHVEIFFNGKLILLAKNNSMTWFSKQSNQQKILIAILPGPRIRAITTERTRNRVKNWKAKHWYKWRGWSASSWALWSTSHILFLFVRAFGNLVWRCICAPTDLLTIFELKVWAVG